MAHSLMMSFRTRRPLGDILRDRRKLDDNGAVDPRLLKRIGAYVTARAERAFVDQRFGSKRWDERYPNQDSPRINVAGALSDLINGGNIAANRFDVRPAGVSSGVLKQSIRDKQVGKNAVAIGTNVPYAADVQYGLESTIDIPEFIRKKDGPLSRFLKQRPEYQDRLGFLFKRDSLSTRQSPRPFLPTLTNYPEDMRQAILKIIDDFFNGDQ